MQTIFVRLILFLETFAREDSLSSGKAKMAQTHSLHGVNEHFKPFFNDVLAILGNMRISDVFQKPYK